MPELPEDKFTNTVEDAAEYERVRQGGVPRVTKPRPRPQPDGWDDEDDPCGRRHFE